MANETGKDVKKPRVVRKPPDAKKAPEKKPSIWAKIISVTALVLAVIALIAFLLPSASKFGVTTTTSTAPKTATSTEKKAAPAAPTPAQNTLDEGIYKGWQKYENKTWGLSARYPVGWTITEVAGGSSVIFLGPAMPASTATSTGGVIQNECSFSIFVEAVSATIKLEGYIATARSAPQGGGDITNQNNTTVNENEAIEIVDTYADAGQPWKRSRVWTIKNGKAYTFTYAASPNYNTVDYYVMHEADYEQIMDSIFIK